MNDKSFPVDLFYKKEFNANSVQKKINDALKTPSTEENLLGEELHSSIKNKVGLEKYQTYFAETFKIVSIEKEKIIFSTSTPFIKKIIEHQFVNFINQAIVETLGKTFNIDITISEKHEPEIITNMPELESQLHPSLKEFTKSIDVPSEDPKQDKFYQINKGKSVKETSFSLNELHPMQEDLPAHVHSSVLANQGNIQTLGLPFDVNKNFNSFIVGPSNNLAHASAVAVANNPGQVYQSLYIYGNSGLGKTHLLHAIANQITKNTPTLRLHLTTATEFMTEMISAIQDKMLANFRRKYYELTDVLMIDDIHELKNREGTQNEFFHIFNELQRRKKQLIFTSDKEPKEITGIEERIKTRLSSALVIEIQQPDLETRIAILKKKAIDKDIYLPDDVVTLIASCIKNNIRELEGSLIRLGAYSSIFKVDIDLQTAKEQLKINEDDQHKTINIETITKTVSQFYKIPIPDIRSKSRSKEIATARHIAMYLCYYMAKATLTEIGNFFGKRDHTSVIHAVNKIKSLQKSDLNIAQVLYEIECQL